MACGCIPFRPWSRLPDGCMSQPHPTAPVSEHSRSSLVVWVRNVLASLSSRQGVAVCSRRETPHCDCPEADLNLRQERSRPFSLPPCDAVTVFLVGQHDSRTMSCVSA